jgi:peptidyl-tRNA hydrolase
VTNEQSAEQALHQSVYQPGPGSADEPTDPLAPLRGRYAYWLGLDAGEVLDDRDEDPDQIRAMQLILRMERDRTPSWHAAVRLAASGAARLCLDPRIDADPGWRQAISDYAAGHIRKVTRRGRGAQWEGTADLPGLTLSDGDTEVRVLLPDLVSRLDKRVAKLQVGGTDAPVDEPPAGAPDDDALQVWVPEEPVMTLGKTMAQTGHAGMIAAALLAGRDAGGDPDQESTPLQRWYADGCPVDARRADARKWQQLMSLIADPAAGWRDHRALAVRDAGFTEIAPGTVTVIAVAPR